MHDFICLQILMQLRAPGVLHAVARPEHLVHAGRPLEGDGGVEAGLLPTVQYSTVQYIEALCGHLAARGEPPHVHVINEGHVV